MAARRKTPKKKARSTKPARKSKGTNRGRVSAKKPAPRGKKSSRRKRPYRSTSLTEKSVAQIRQGVGLAEGGQSGDLQGLSGVEDVDSESVRELAEEGQDFEAGIVAGVENAPDPDVSEVRTREVPEDDVPEEYRDQDL